MQTVATNYSKSEETLEELIIGGAKLKLVKHFRNASIPATVNTVRAFGILNQKATEWYQRTKLIF